MFSSALKLLGTTPLSRRKAMWGMALVAPNVLGLMFFFGIPVLIAFWTAFQDWNGIKPAQYAGFEKFELMQDDPYFETSLKNTIVLTLYTVPAGTVLALGAAVLLNQPLRGRSFFRTLYFLPVVTSTVAASVVWTWIFQPRYGIVNSWLEPLGYGETKWLTDPDYILVPIAAVAIWQRLGFNIVLFLAGLQAVPSILHEAATIDGANRWQRFLHVTLPMLSPTTFLVVVLGIISSFQIFDQIYVMTSRYVPGGVRHSASTLAYYLYERAFTGSDFGYGSAIALVLFGLILLVTVIQLSLQRFWVYYESNEG
ncbi:MAG TPA: sugar ABC transporter permease [Aggregatilineaceae bacterium]|nr:sugar ABC transporter permease [Aggregatilineaceae bacterium]